MDGKEELDAAHLLRGWTAADITGVGRSEAATAAAIPSHGRQRGSGRRD
jgi:bisphosphoglycerate-dependent phosphoglycerate mutase